MRILADLHHLSLYNSLVRLFDGRLGHEVYRPIGMEWYTEDFWGINDQVDTARQYLSLDQAYTPRDGTSALNKMWISGLPGEEGQGVWFIRNPEDKLRPHKACTLEWFKDHRFDVIIASIPQHVTMFRDLIRLYQPWAKLVVQLGNSWNMDLSADHNLLCSVEPGEVRGFDRCHSVSYHQEFSLEVFRPDPVKHEDEPAVSSFVNCIEEKPQAWADFLHLEQSLPYVTFKAYGGQCRDGCLSLQGTAGAMRGSQLVFHVKPGGDGYGHVVHQAYATGRVIITRKSHYRGKLAERLMIPRTYIDVDEFEQATPAYVHSYLSDPDRLAEASALASDRFRSVVDFDAEEIMIRKWLEDLR